MVNPLDRLLARVGGDMGRKIAMVGLIIIIASLIFHYDPLIKLSYFKVTWITWARIYGIFLFLFVLYPLWKKYRW